MTRNVSTHERFRPRLAVVCTQLGYGGAERQTYELMRQLKGTEWEPAMAICLSEHLHPYGPLLTSLGYPVHVLRRRGNFDVNRLLRLRFLLRREKVTVVHAVHLLASGYVWLATRASSVRLLPTVRGTVVRPGYLRGTVYRRLLSTSPVTLVNSHQGAKFVAARFGVPIERLVVVPNGIDFAALRKAASSSDIRHELAIPADAPLIGFVGKNSRVKNVPLFLEVARRLRARYRDLHVILAGLGLDESGRALLDHAPHDDHLHWVGPRDDLPAIVAELDLLLLTSHSEGCPNVVLEALGLGTPVVATNVGDVSRMIQGGAGAVVRPGDADALAEEAGRILHLGRSVRCEVEKTWPFLERSFSISAMVSQTVALWESLQDPARTTGRVNPA